MIDWKKLFLPTSEKIIILIIIFYLFGIYFPKIATCNDCIFVKLGIPYPFYWIGGGDDQSKFSFSYLVAISFFHW